MGKIGFDINKYLEMQSKFIHDRISKFGGKLYLEFGGKLFDDTHASRVLPGFAPDTKLRMLNSLKDEAEIIIAINAADVERNKIRGDLGITYDLDVLRLIDVFRSNDFYVGSVVITQYRGQQTINAFKKRLENIGIKVYLHFPIEGYPTNVQLIVSDNGYGKNEYIETTRPLVVMTAPGPGSGKMATCLSQLYHESKNGVNAGYAKFETFPVWNIPLTAPVNLAYEAATADLDDVNMIDPYHMEAYGEATVNYNRDVEAFPVLSAILNKIYGSCPYKSPTDMGVNMVGHCITDMDLVNEASGQEIIRRYYNILCEQRIGRATDESVYKIELLLSQLGLSKTDRKVAVAALEKSKNELPTAAFHLLDGRIVTGKTSSLLGASSAALLNALKVLGDIDDSVQLISPSVIKPIQLLKTKHLGNKNPHLHTDEILIALSVAGNTDTNAKLAMKQLPKLRGCEFHSTVILSEVDSHTLQKLGVNLTCEPKYQLRSYAKKAIISKE